MMKLSLVIPVYNEDRTVKKLLDRVWEVPLPGFEKEMIIVESNSTDGTRKIVKDFFETAEKLMPGTVKLILQDQALGKGAAVREGFGLCTGDIIMIQDGDLEYDVNDYPSLLQPIVEGKTCFVLGSRHLSAGSWKIRRFDKAPIRSSLLNFGGVFFHTIFNILYGQSLTDPTTMYKVFRRSCLDGLSFSSNRFDFDFELLAKLIRSGFQPLEVPVSYGSRGFSEGKKVRIFRDPFTWLRAIIKFRFIALNRRDEQSKRTITSQPR